jgi:hypothetical protein
MPRKGFNYTRNAGKTDRTVKAYLDWIEECTTRSELVKVFTTVTSHTCLSVVEHNTIVLSLQKRANTLGVSNRQTTPGNN